MAAVRLTTVCLTLINIMVSYGEQHYKFPYGSKEYIIELQRAVGYDEASNICRDDYHATVANVVDDLLLEKLNEWLYSLNINPNVHTELWTKGDASGYIIDYIDIAQKHKPGPSEKIVPGFDRIANADCMDHNLKKISGNRMLHNTSMTECVHQCRITGCAAFLMSNGDCYLKSVCNAVVKVNFDIDLYIPKKEVSGYRSGPYNQYGDWLKTEEHPHVETCGVVCSDMDNCGCFTRNQSTCTFFSNCQSQEILTEIVNYLRRRQVVFGYEHIMHHKCGRIHGNPVQTQRPLNYLNCANLCSSMDNCVAFEAHLNFMDRDLAYCDLYSVCGSNIPEIAVEVYRRYNSQCRMLSNRPNAAHSGFNMYSFRCSGKKNIICERPVYTGVTFPAQLPAFPFKLRESFGWIARFDDFDYDSILTGLTVYTDKTTGEVICIAFTYGHKKAPCRGNQGAYPDKTTAIENSFMLERAEFFINAEIRTRLTWRFPVISQITLKTSFGKTFGPVGVSIGTLQSSTETMGIPIIYVSGISGDKLNQLQFHFYDRQVTHFGDMTNLLAFNVYTAYQNGNMAKLMKINTQYQNMIPSVAERTCDIFTNFVVTGTARVPFEWGCKLMLIIQQLDMYTSSSDILKKHLPRNLIHIADYDSRVLLNVESDARNFQKVLSQVLFAVTQVGNELQNTVISVNQEVATGLQDYFVTVAEFDRNIATADRDFIVGRLQTLTTESRDLSEELEIRLRIMLSIALAVTTVDVAESIARLAAAIAKASNPIGWITGGNDANDVQDEMAQVAEAQRRLAQAVRLSSTLHIFTDYLKELGEKVNQNQDQLDATRRVVDGFVNATDAGRVTIANHFLRQYNNYKPHVKAFEVVYATELLATVVEEGCSLIDGVQGTIANALGTALEVLQIPPTLATGKPQTICTQLPAMIAKLEQMYYSVFDFQFELMDAFASIARENIVQGAARGIDEIATAKTIDVVTATVGSLNGAMRTQNAAKSRCFELEYKSGGNLPTICKHFFFTDPILSKITAYEGTVQSSTSVKFGFIPMTPPDGKRTLTYIDVEELISTGVTHFQLPINDREWMVKYGWLPPSADNETAYFIEKFEMFIPGLICKGKKTYTIGIDVTSAENVALYKETAPPSYVIPEALLRFVYTAAKKKKSPSCASGKIIDFEVRQNNTQLSLMGIKKVCEVSGGETVNDLKPSVYSNWIIKLIRHPACKLVLQKPKQKKKKKKKNKKNKAVKQPLITVRYRRVDVIAKGIDECYPNTRCGINQSCVDQVLSYRCQDINP